MPRRKPWQTWTPPRQPKPPTLKTLAAQIEKEFPDLVAIVYPANHPLGGFCNTDRKIPGTRLRRPGRGRRGSRLVVSIRPGHGDGRIVFEHNAAETYRTNAEVVAWIERERRSRANGMQRPAVATKPEDRNWKAGW